MAVYLPRVATDDLSWYFNGHLIASARARATRLQRAIVEERLFKARAERCLERVSSMGIAKDLEAALAEENMLLRAAQDVRAAFAQFDRDGNGYLDADEIRQALANLGIVATKAESVAVLTKYDIDRSGGIDVSEFTQIFDDLVSTDMLSAWIHSLLARFVEYASQWLRLHLDCFVVAS